MELRLSGLGRVKAPHSRRTRFTSRVRVMLGPLHTFPQLVRPRKVSHIASNPVQTQTPSLIGYLITGSQDALISVYILGSPSEDPKYMLLGHQHNVCALHASPDGTIISGSWDK